jgi:hypothetical protein
MLNGLVESVGFLSWMMGRLLERTERDNLTNVRKRVKKDPEWDCFVSVMRSIWFNKWLVWCDDNNIRPNVFGGFRKFLIYKRLEGGEFWRSHMPCKGKKKKK